MRPLKRRVVSLAIASVAMSMSLAATSKETACNTDTLIVFDASGSMALHADGRTRIDQARAALADVLPEITANRRAGLLTYSGIANLQPAPRCGGIYLRVPLMPNAASAIAEKLVEIAPAGLTPLTAAVEQAAVELDATARPGVVVLVTDGLETCGRSPCALARQLRASSPSLTVHVIGYFLGPEQAVHVRCLADETGGLYVPAQSFEEMRAALRTLSQCKAIS